jgi:hypothetical protein
MVLLPGHLSSQKEVVTTLLDVFLLLDFDEASN